MDSQKTALHLLRPDYLDTQRLRGDRRSPERLLAHYLLERELAERLKSASKEERGRVYTEVYTRLFASLPDHPQHTAGRSEETAAMRFNLAVLSGLLPSGATFLEMGCGDAVMSYAIAAKVSRTYGLDVTDALIDNSRKPDNFRFLRTVNNEIDLPDNSVDVVYSDQLLEHLHPDDTEYQTREIVRVLKPGGSYWCSTPNRLTGPHDVSCYFDYTAMGFHLREYDYSLMRALFKRAGFRKVRFFITANGHHVTFPYWMARMLEGSLGSLPLRIRSRLSRLLLIRGLLRLNALGTKWR